MKAKINNLIRFFKQNREITVILIFILIMIVVFVVENIVRKPQALPNTDTKFNVTKKTNQIVWEQAGTGIVPGATKYVEAKGLFSSYDYKGKKNMGNAFAYKYTSIDGQYDEVEIGVTRDETVRYLNLKTHPFKKVAFDDYINKYGLGNPDIVKEIKEIAGHLAYVYLEKGLIVYVRTSDNKVSYEIYFTPMSEEEFGSFWGYKLTESYDLNKLKEETY